MGEMKLVAIPGWLLEIIEKYHITRFAKVIVMWDSDDNPEIISHRKHSEEMEEMNVWIIYDEEGNVKDFPGIDYLYDDTELNIYDEGRIIPEADTENFLAVSSNILMIKWEQVEGSEVYVCIFSQYPDGTQIREYKRRRKNDTKRY